MSLEPGSVFAQDYKVISLLAEGGMGAVFVVEQTSTGRKRALKVLRPILAENRDAVDRFLREAKLSAKIESEHVVEIIDAGIDMTSKSPYIVMELLDGGDLSSFVKHQGPTSVSQALDFLRQLAHALTAAHQAGVIHRDLKPENVFIAKSKRSDGVLTVKLLDFGIASMLEGSATSASTSHVVGSPAWMAPEQIDAARLRPATDVWAFGLLTFWLLTGMHYWKSANQEGSTMQALLVEKLVEPMQWPSERAALFQRRWPLGADYDRWFASVVERNPEQRTQSMAQAWAQLEPILQQASQSNAMIGGAPTLMGGPLSAPSMGSWPGSSSVPTGRAMMSYAPGAVAQTVLSSPTGPGPTQTAKNSAFSLAKWLGPAAALSVIALGSIASRYRATPSAISSTMTLESSRGQHVISYSLGAVDAGAIVINESDVLPAIAVVAVTRPESVPEVRRQRISVVPAQRNTRTLVRDAGVAAVAVAQAVQAPTLSPRGRPMGSRCPQYAQSYRLANSFVSRAQLVQATDPAQANSLRLQGAAIRQGLDQQFANQQHMARTTLAGDPDFVDMVRELERCRAQPGFGQF